MNRKSVLAARLLLTPFFLIAAFKSYAAEVKISSVTVEPMKIANLCSSIGGRGKDPKLTIKHSKLAGAKIRIKMFDKVSNGRTVNHYSTTIKASPSGTTRISYGFRPPCNTTGNSTSNYYFSVSSGKSRKTVKWGRYNSITKKIIR